MASEIGLIAKLDPTVDEEDSRRARRDIERDVTSEPIEMGVEFDRKQLEEAQQRAFEDAKFERMLDQGKKRVKSAAGTAGGMAKRGAKFGGHVAATKAMRKIGIPTTMPSTDALDSILGTVGGGSGGSATPPSSSGGPGVGGSTASEPEEVVPLLQSQLAVQEEILEVIEDDGLGGGGGGGGGGDGGILSSIIPGLGGGGGLLSTLIPYEIGKQGTGGILSKLRGLGGRMFSGLKRGGGLLSKMLKKGGKGRIASGLRGLIGRSPFTLLSQTAGKRQAPTREEFVNNRSGLIESLTTGQSFREGIREQLGLSSGSSEAAAKIDQMILDYFESVLNATETGPNDNIAVGEGDPGVVDETTADGSHLDAPGTGNQAGTNTTTTNQEYRDATIGLSRGRNPGASSDQTPTERARENRAKKDSSAKVVLQNKFDITVPVEDRQRKSRKTAQEVEQKLDQKLREIERRLSG
jgi:hypothetical protein